MDAQLAVAEPIEPIEPIDDAEFEHFLRHGERRNHMADARGSRWLAALTRADLRKRPWARHLIEPALRKFEADARRSLALARPERPNPAPQIRARAPRRRSVRAGSSRARAPAEPSPSPSPKRLDAARRGVP